MSAETMHTGVLPSGSRYVIEAPLRWNGTLLLYSRPVPVRAGEPPWSDDLLVNQLVEHGYAVAGSANTIFWPVEQAFSDHPALLEIAGRDLGSPRHTIGVGVSIGGIIMAGLVQRFPGLLSGALPMCGNLAGAVGVHNTELDIAFVVRTLLAPDSALQIVKIENPFPNLGLARTLLHQAQTTPSGRARLALAAAVGNIPGWEDAASAQPAPEDFVARQRNQFAWFEEVNFLVYFMARAQVEWQAGGNPSWNTGVDYGRLLAASINRDEVEALYAAATLDLAKDLEALASAPRIEADRTALAYLERHIVFSGDLGGVPVLTVHTDGDGLVTPDNERAYADVVSHAGQGDLLRQVYVHRAGHCTFTLAEVLTALELLIARIEGATWPSLDPEALNTSATSRADGHRLPSGEPMESRFFGFEPPPFLRRYDVRDVGSTGQQSTTPWQ